MKRLGTLLLVLFLLIPTLGLAGQSVSPNTAQKFYVPIMCADAPRGTGFPVGANLLMTAGHVRCDDGDETKISFDQGATWVVEPDANWFVNGDADIAILIVQGGIFSHIAKFRAPKLGESVSGFGITFDGLFVTGTVAHIDEEYLFSTAPPFGGMSGSAMVGSDGKVIGMTNFGVPDERVGGALTGGYRGDLLAILLDSFKKFMEAQ